jgi:PhnB protein
MATIPYLHFQGTCAEALAFYAEVFGGSGLSTMRYAQAPGTPGDWAESTHVMHGQVDLPGGRLMASDFPPGFEGDPQKAVSVMQTLPDVGTAKSAFDRLLDEGGDLIQPWGPTFFAEGFGMVRDRFGTHWIISSEPAAEEAPPAGAAEVEAHPS